jgi:aldehyde dehydrogenase (NAD+)
VSFSGPTKQGRWIASICGAELKPARLELGGQSAAIILDDADLGKAGDALGRLIFGNSGQTCFAMSRVLVPEQRYGDLVDALAGAAGALRVGDPLSESTTMGPMASSRRRVDVESQVRSGVGDGARVVSGGRRPASPVRGYFYEPTVLIDVTPQMAIARDEICGPVATVISYKDEAEAVRFANDGFGLAATVWTGDPQRGLDIARRTRVGTFGINLYEPDIGSPWGGRGPSGSGSAYGPEGMDAYLTSKSVFLPSLRAQLFAGGAPPAPPDHGGLRAPMPPAVGTALRARRTHTVVLLEPCGAVAGAAGPAAPIVSASNSCY